MNQRTFIIAFCPVIIGISGFCFNGFSGNQIIAESHITNVTVYTDRALITRSTEVKIQKGEQEIRFSGLPAGLDQNSVQANGKGKAVIRDVRFSYEQLAGVADPQLQKLIDRREILQDSLRIADGRTANASGQKMLIESIMKKVTSPSPNPEKTPAPELDPAKWTGIVAFYRKSMDQLDEEARSIETLKKDIARRIDKINREINEQNANANRSRPTVDVLLEGKEAGTAELELSYLVPGPSWTPSYTVRVSSESKKMNLTYNAYIRQNTGENWAGITLKVSTASPSIGGIPPALNPWYVDIFRPRPSPRQAGAMYKMKKEMAPSAAMSELRMDKAAVEYDEMVPEPMPAMTVENSAVTAGKSSAVYSVPGKKDIAPDNQDHLVALAVFELPVEFSFLTIPKIQRSVFLKVKVTNSTDYTFLPGATSVFLDNAFVSTGSLETISPSQSFETSLGVDEQIHVDYKQVNKYQKDEGVIAKKSKFLYNYTITLKNNKKTDEEIIVRDQIPVSRHQDITISLIPNDKSPALNPVADKTGQIEWKTKIKAGQEINIPFAFSIEYPRDLNVDGL